MAPKKIKFLCSFGGKILPRPTDGAFRYVGGHTRIISVPRDIPFPELINKMSETFSGPAVLKYQLPDEDLDALISVSCPEDLENMIDEYDKLAESSPDGSTKLRAFLFGPDGIDGFEDGGGVGYLEAVNGVGDGGSASGSLRRKDSGLSAGSSTHSDLGTGGDAEVGMNAQITQKMNSPNYVDQLLSHGHPVELVNLKPSQPYLGENLYGGLNSKVVQPLSQFPPLPPCYQQQALGQGVRLNDCYKELPHAHSDTVVQDAGSGQMEKGSEVSGVSSVFYSQARTMPHLVNGGLVDNVAEPRVDAMGGQVGGYGYPQVSEGRYDGHKIENLEHSRVFLPPGSMGLSPDAQSSYGLFLGNFPQQQQQQQLQQNFLGNFPQYDEFQQQQQQLQQQQLQQNMGSPRYSVRPEAVAKPRSNDAGLVRNAIPPGLEPLNRDSLPEFTYDYVKPVSMMMEGLQLGPTEASGFHGQRKAVASPNSAPLLVEDPYGFRQQFGESVVSSSRAFATSGVVPDAVYVKPVDQLPSATSDFTRMPNLQHADTNQMSAMTGNHVPYSHYLGSRVEPPMPSEGLLVMPTYTTYIDPAYSDRTANKIPAGDWKDEPSQFQSRDMLNHLAATHSGNVPIGLSNATSPTRPLGTFQEPTSSDSLFCNQDPRKILGGTHTLPPKPRRVPSRESVVPKDSCTEFHLGNSTESEIFALLEEGGLNPSLSSLNKDSHMEPMQLRKGSGDEQIKQDLQAVAEGVATSVFESSETADPCLFANDTNDANHGFKDESKSTEDKVELQGALKSDYRKNEDNKPKHADKMNPGVRITDSIGRLQIINNSDLEELRELGSGTFGTVYHGKWRGSDVAIKRINDRCFAGKPSEQERMRADFWNEASKLADLHHPNVVTFYGVVLDGPGGSVATVTEYMVNGSLRNALQRNDKALDRRKKLIIAMDVAFGMEYLHGKNIVHFDLKSDNLLVNLRDPQRPICKVGDLGLSKVKCQTLISGGVRGTLPWMAPELLNGSSSLVSEKVDVFSFGIVMWELLTGEEPYADLHYGTIIGGIVSNTLRPPVPESCDPEWRSLMEKCWSADPPERPSFTEIADRLRSMATSPPAKGLAQAQVQK